MSKKATPDKLCPCQSGQDYNHCCGRFIKPAGDTGKLPETAEQLMRSRYTAFTQGNSEYLLNTWHPDHRPEQLDLENSPPQWIGLSIKHTERGQAQDSIGNVHFVARYKINGKAHRLEENSRFIKIDGRWFYSNGQLF